MKTDFDVLSKLGSVAFAFIFFVVGFIFLYLAGRITDIHCVRGDGRQGCVLDTTWMGLVPLNQVRLPEMVKAEVEESCDEDGCTYRVNVVTGQRIFPLGEAYSSGRAGKEETAAQINAFIRDESIPTLDASSGGGWWIIVPLAFIGMSFYMGFRPAVALVQAALARRGA
ncbi:MAG: hypothetical protein HY835_05585 [Anaerolineae bacterium]|nr:hypothetical protein [Anaerolineae bacterium]